MYDRWRTHNVPAVEIVEFAIGRHDPDSPWLNRARGPEQITPQPPQYLTARHLCVDLRNASAEAVAAYKVMAYCRTKGAPDFAQTVLRRVVTKEAPDIELWHSIAREVLPDSRGDTVISVPTDARDQIAMWPQVVDAAAGVWTQIARRRGLIRIPAFMDKKSPQLRAWKAHLADEEERREWAEYQRLKKKFEGRGRPEP